MKQVIVIVIILVSIAQAGFGQTDYSVLEKGIKINLNEEGSMFMKPGFGTQIIARYMQFNPETLDSRGNPISGEGDISLYRTYVSLYASLGRFTYFVMPAMAAQANTTAASPFMAAKPSFFLYDNWLGYQVVRNKLMIGAGLNMYNGVSRLTSSSSGRTLGMDVPVITAPNLITTDQSARQLSVFASGKIGHFDYRVAVAKPFRCERMPETPAINTAYDVANTSPAYKGYFQYQFFDTESAMMPFYSATYIGTKKVLNIGAGVDYHPKSTATVTDTYGETGALTLHNKTHVGIDIFADIPFGKNMAISFYSAYYYYNYGPNYLLSFAAMNPYPNAISEVQLGTGNAVLTQLGYLLPVVLKSGERFQLYAVATYCDFEAMQIPSLHYDVGMNVFVAGHNLKCTIEWQRRPNYKQSTNSNEYKNLLACRLQVLI